MRDIIGAMLVALVVLALGLCMAYAVIDTQQRHAQLHNPYWPYSVETSIHDK